MIRRFIPASGHHGIQLELQIKRQFVPIHLLAQTRTAFHVTADSRRCRKPLLENNRMTMTKICSLTVLSLLALIQVSVAFAPLLPSSHFGAKPTSALFAEEGNKAGPLVSGEELEMILTELEKPLVIDAYATW